MVALTNVVNNPDVKSDKKSEDVKTSELKTTKKDFTLTDDTAMITITEIIEAFETRKDQPAYAFPIAKLRGCLEKMPKTGS